ncbi:hypothetical protein FA13DRAFT_389601 [Coprinellus micaceus]|uniref:Uncharacterized protein n=1 Tax=Coprinellus micaceus TaxID=71717 RepID=A0A4Y7TXG5_COPMI|nr:hypothetical protein FA13DRAFT_389601 [Coprinellus micaceus]
MMVCRRLRSVSLPFDLVPTCARGNPRTPVVRGADPPGKGKENRLRCLVRAPTSIVVWSTASCSAPTWVTFGFCTSDSRFRRHIAEGELEVPSPQAQHPPHIGLGLDERWVPQLVGYAYLYDCYDGSLSICDVYSGDCVISSLLPALLTRPPFVLVHV